MRILVDTSVWVEHLLAAARQADGAGERRISEVRSGASHM
jgi:hypothetical protein